MRRSSSLLLAVIAASCAAHAALAQPPTRPPRPYTPVAITRPAASDDASFAAFRTALAAAVKSRVYAELAPLVVERSFFWGRDFGQRFDPRKPPVDNLANAIALEQGNGIGWRALAVFAAEATVEPLDSRPGVICAPARPEYDSIVFAKLLDATVTSDIDWAYPRADETPVLGAPQPGSAKIGTLGLHFVRLLGFDGSEQRAQPRPCAMGARSLCPMASRALSPPAA